MLRALVFDVDGTLADTEDAHRAAFNQAFAEVGRDWYWDDALYTRLLDVSGGKERILHYWRLREPGLIDIGDGVRDTVERIHAIKTAAYEAAVRGGAVVLRPGVLALIDSAYRRGLWLAIATTTSPVNIAALMRAAIGPDWSHYFAVVEDASTAPRKKPHPQVYLQTARRLGLDARDLLALEDSANGLQAARAAGLPTMITRNRYTRDHDFSGALRVLDDLEGVTVDMLCDWHARAVGMPQTAGGVS